MANKIMVISSLPIDVLTQALHTQLLRAATAAHDEPMLPDVLLQFCQRLGSQTGKALRAQLAFTAGQMFVVDQESALLWAVCCELLHYATLVHDDIQDGDTLRRNQPTVWAQIGIPQAINWGDFLLQAPFWLIATANTIPADIKVGLITIMSQKMGAVIAGQCVDCSALALNDLTAEAYQACVRQKTSSLLVLPVQGAALLANKQSTQIKTWCRAISDLGVLFQMHDDLLDLYGDKERGERGADLREGKISAVIIEHLQRRPRDHARLLALLRMSREQTPTTEIAWAITAFQESGAAQLVHQRIQQQCQQLLKNLSTDFQSALRPLLQFIAQKLDFLP